MNFSRIKWKIQIERDHLPVFEEVYGKVYSGKIDFQRIVITLLYVEVLLENLLCKFQFHFKMEINLSRKMLFWWQVPKLH